MGIVMRSRSAMDITSSSWTKRRARYAWAPICLLAVLRSCRGSSCSSVPKVMKAGCTLYTAASNLDTGARVAVAYDNDIFLYSILIDALRYSTAQQEETLLPPNEPFHDVREAHILPHPTSNAAALLENVPETEGLARLESINMLWAHWLPASRHEGPASAEEIWPLQIPGTFVGSMPFPVALAVQAGSAVAVWAFGRDGETEMWCI